MMVYMFFSGGHSVEMPGEMRIHYIILLQPASFRWYMGNCHVMSFLREWRDEDPQAPAILVWKSGHQGDWSCPHLQKISFDEGLVFDVYFFKALFIGFAFAHVLHEMLLKLMTLKTGRACSLAPVGSCGPRRNGSNTWEPMPEMWGSPVIVLGFGQEVGLMVRWFVDEFNGCFWWYP